jgi:hypothetical protein
MAVTHLLKLGMHRFVLLLHLCDMRFAEFMIPETQLTFRYILHLHACAIEATRSAPAQLDYTRLQTVRGSTPVGKVGTVMGTALAAVGSR